MDVTYLNWIQDLKQKIRTAQLKASIAVNDQMILLYWDIGKNIVEKQEENHWGSKIVERMAKDLKKELPDTDGFSRTNLFAMRKFYLFYKESPIVHQLGGQLEENELGQQAAGQLIEFNEKKNRKEILITETKHPKATPRSQSKTPSTSNFVHFMLPWCPLC